MPFEPGSGGPAGPLILLAGLRGVYAHGLCTALADSRLACCCLPDLEEMDQVLAAADSVLLVTPEERASRVLAAVPRPRRPQVQLAWLLADPDPRTYLRGLRAGVVGLVPQDAELTDVIHLLSSAQQGRTVLPVSVLQVLARSVGGVGADLSDTERSWLSDLASGRTVGELARRSAYSEREMYRVLGRLYRRLGTTNRSAALLAAQRAGLLT